MDHPDMVYERIWNLRENGSNKTAFELCWSAANAYGRDCRFWLALGVIAGEQNKYCHATMALERAATLTPLSPCVQCRLGWAYLQTGETESARQIFKALCAKGELQTQLLPIMSAGLGRLGEYHLALDLCREAVRRDPDADEAYRGLAYYMSRCGYPAEVILATMRKAAQLAPEREDYRLTIAGLLEKVGQERDALEIYDRFSHEFLNRIECGCCLQRLMGIYVAAGDDDRYEICRARFKKLPNTRRKTKNREGGCL